MWQVPGILTNEDPGPHNDAHQGEGTLGASWDGLNW